MLRWAWDILVGNFCKHAWEVIDENRFIGWDDLNHCIYAMRCRNCGNIKRKRV